MISLSLRETALAWPGLPHWHIADTGNWVRRKSEEELSRPSNWSQTSIPSRV